MSDVQISLEAGAGLERRLRVCVPAANVDQEVETRLKSVGMTARLKGFRPGKVPAEVIRQRFGAQLRQEVVQDLVQSSFTDAVGREKLRPAGSPRFEMGAANDGQDLVYTAIFEVYPEFRVAGVEGLRIEKPEVAVTDADVDQTIERLRLQRSSWSPVQRPAARGDRVIIDFSGSRNGEPLPGGKGDRVGVVVGEGRMIADFEANLAGLAAGDGKTFTASFPATYHEAGLRGAQAEFTVRVHEVAERKLPAVDGEFIRAFEVASGDMGEFRSLVRENLEREVASKTRSELRRQVMEGLLVANPIEVPLALVNREASSLQAEAQRGVGEKGVSPSAADNSYSDVARRRVQLSLIMGALISEQGLQVDRNQVEQRLDEICQGYDRPAEVRKLYAETPSLMAQIENSVMEEQVMTWIIGRAAVAPRQVSFAALMGV